MDPTTPDDSQRIDPNVLILLWGVWFASERAQVNPVNEEINL